ncbi:FAD-dependent oxidoreductase [Microvirga terricola]|uniref:FAD-dependent oxidoreductase n=1 Tax=Microvirga terricola TaxID=2719797 RepID=A0ABX0VAR7_9HYPH|nr:FAD-dependent oxidoreductase [Microvirga terricola]NIX76593.1 FAD-dependent oxidoreductase [Microvirga terricola]
MSELSVAVVGAGIGGLTTALALARQGHAITLIERRTGFSEVGAGLQLSPNASRILIDLGLGAALRRAATEPARVVVRSIRSGRQIGQVALGPFMRSRFGAPYWVIHRADLQTILLDAVRSTPTIRLLIGRKVEEVHDGPFTASVTMTTQGGARETLSVDAVIGADGVWSKVRAALGETASPAFRGYVAWRATLDRSAAPAPLAGDETGLWLGPRGHVVHYPVASGRLVNVVAIERAPEPVEGWAAPGDGSELQSHYASAAPALQKLLAQPSQWLRWSLFDLPATTLVKGRIALLGDAAHPVLPFLAQGAALAIEDAATLALLMTDAGRIPQAFATYAEKRLDRVRKVQGEARQNGRVYHMGGLMAFGRNQVMRHLGPEGMTERYSWLYDFRPTA